jgi:hypothetical protein
MGKCRNPPRIPWAGLNGREVVDSLLFPVKLGAAFSIIGLVWACGYHPVYSGEAPSVRLAVASGSVRVAEPVALDGALDGARSVLAREGALGTAQGYPRLVVEVLRIDELARGMFREGLDAARAVNSRGASVAVTVRGWVEEGRGARPSRDTGDVSRAVTYAHRGDARLDTLARQEAVRAAAREAGEALARRVLGDPEPSIELP